MLCLIGNRPQTTITRLLKHMAHYQMQVEWLYFRDKIEKMLSMDFPLPCSAIADLKLLQFDGSKNAMYQMQQMQWPVQMTFWKD